MLKWLWFDLILKKNGLIEIQFYSVIEVLFWGIVRSETDY
jgi:hypothetical protein